MKQNYWLIIIVVIAIFGGLYILNSQGKEKQTINAAGSAVIKTMPDEASVLIRIETLDTSAEKSKEENTKISNNVLAALNSIDMNDVETIQFNIYPQYSWEDGKQKIEGYTTTNILKVKTKFFDDVGVIVDKVVGAGATIDGINFELTDQREKELKKEALSKASEDAKGKAEAIADGLGAKLGKVVSVSESNYYYRPYPLYAKGGEIALEQAVTQINPQELEVSADVNVVFAIK